MLNLLIILLYAVMNQIYINNNIISKFKHGRKGRNQQIEAYKYHKRPLGIM